MSMVANLSINEIGEMHCWCPACGERIEVDETDFCGTLPNGDEEYFLYCPECGQGFYAAESYYNPDWKKEDKQ